MVDLARKAQHVESRHLFAACLLHSDYVVLLVTQGPSETHIWTQS